MESLEDTNPKDHELVINNFAAVLASNNDIRLYDEIAAEFHKLDLDKQGIKQVQLTSAHPLSKENEKAIIEQLNKIVKGKVEIKKDVDEGLIGGVVIKFDDSVLDVSVKNELEQLKNNLTK